MGFLALRNFQINSDLEVAKKQLHKKEQEVENIRESLAGIRREVEVKAGRIKALELQQEDAHYKNKYVLASYCWLSYTALVLETNKTLDLVHCFKGSKLSRVFASANQHITIKKA